MSKLGWNVLTELTSLLSVSLSHGRNSLTPEDWEEAKRMERERKERAASVPVRTGASLANGMNVHLNSEKK